MYQFPKSLIDGYKTFRAGALARHGAQYRELAESGQKPETMVIACCDSRAAPETIFDTLPGEIFVTRNVANLVPPYRPDGEYHGTSAALEFAVQSLRVKHILVLGHGRCGGIQAALDPAMGPLSPGDFIGRWLELLTPTAREVATEEGLSFAEKRTHLEFRSIRNSIENLRSFPCVSILEEKGKLALHGAWFDIADGDLWILDRDSDSFKRVDGD